MRLLGNIKLPIRGQRYLAKFKDLDSFCCPHRLEDVYRSATSIYKELTSDFSIEDHTIVGGQLTWHCTAHKDPESELGSMHSIVSFFCPNTELEFHVGEETMLVKDGDIIFFDSTVEHEVRWIGGKKLWQFMSAYCKEVG